MFVRSHFFVTKMAIFYMFYCSHVLLCIIQRQEMMDKWKMLINVQSDLVYWSKLFLNKNVCWSMKINAGLRMLNCHIHLKAVSDPPLIFVDPQIALYWEEMIRFDRHWLTLISFDILYSLTHKIWIKLIYSNQHCVFIHHFLIHVIASST